MTPQVNRMALFGAWAAQYDLDITTSSDDFPFTGYDEVLSTAVRTAGVRPSLRVLELGIDTGDLAERFVAAGCQVWSLDFSAAMLAEAWTRLPARCLTESPPPYILYEFDLHDKIRLLQRVARHFLAPGGFLVVADIAFPTTAVRATAERWARWWDEDEFYWAADVAIAACAEVELLATYQHVSICAGVFTVRAENGRSAYQ